jgi:hypothetical protein
MTNKAKVKLDIHEWNQNLCITSDAIRQRAPFMFISTMTLTLMSKLNGLRSGESHQRIKQQKDYFDIEFLVRLLKAQEKYGRPKWKTIYFRLSFCFPRFEGEAARL